MYVDTTFKKNCTFVCHLFRVLYIVPSTFFQKRTFQREQKVLRLVWHGDGDEFIPISFEFHKQSNDSYMLKDDDCDDGVFIS